MSNDTSSHKHSLWVGVGEKVISFVVGLVVAAFFLGTARQKIQTVGKEMAEWKEEWKHEKQHITKMDLEGSVATKNFIDHYNKEQGQQYKQLEALQREVKHLETMEYRLNRVERKVDLDPPEQKPKS